MELGIGNTPMVELSELYEALGLKSKIFAKIEGENPAGSIKDRVALKMIQDYEAQGKITPDTLIIEPTSGNTGIGLAYVCKQRGYKAVIVMPDNMSPERIKAIKDYGAQIELTSGALGMAGAIKRAQEIKESTPGAIIAGQFENPSNPAAHYEGTGPEIYENMGRSVDILVCGVGTGGTITGTGRYLKEQNGSIQVVGIEPKNSAVLSGGKAGQHGLQGIGAGFIPSVLDTTVIDKIVTVTDEQAYQTVKLLYKAQGIMAGISAGAALFAAIEIAKEESGKRIAVILPDTGKRYLSLNLFE